jgi:hypothetical protein
MNAMRIQFREAIPKRQLSPKAPVSIINHITSHQQKGGLFFNAARDEGVEGRGSGGFQRIKKVRKAGVHPLKGAAQVKIGGMNKCEGCHDSPNAKDNLVHP